MENVKSRVEKDGLVIELSGHIDSSNAEAAEAAINEARSKSKEGSFTLDAQNLEYISSAGLTGHFTAFSGRTDPQAHQRFFGGL
jgi:anti-anti-sigma factor